MAVTAHETGAQFVISTGDNFYPKGLKSADDPQFQTTFEQIYDDPALMIPWYVVLGNHDYRGNVTAQIGRASINNRWQMPSAYYKHSEVLKDGSVVEFFFIDSEALRKRYDSWVPRWTRDPQIEWLERELANSKAAWKITVGHHPLYAGGMHGGEPALIQQLKPLFEKYGVHAYLNGHDHHMEHVIMGGTHYLTSGAGGSSRPAKASEGTQFVMGDRLGFMTARLKPDTLEIGFVDDKGARLYRARITRDTYPPRLSFPTQ
jgi:acid phosphatase